MDGDENLGEGLTHVVSEEGLNYLMFSVNDRERESATPPPSDQETLYCPVTSTSDEEAKTASQGTTASSSEEGINYLQLSAKDLMQTTDHPHSLELSDCEGPG